MTCATDPFDSLLMEAIPGLRAYARSLCRNSALADDIVQDALLNAWRNQASLREVDHIRPWLLAIVRNAFLAHTRKTRTEIEDVDGAYAARLVAAPAQPAAVELTDVGSALARLPIEEREAIALVCIDRLSYKEAAEVCGCPPGTMKSRVNRARARLLAILKEDTDESGKTQQAPAPAGKANRSPPTNSSVARLGLHTDATHAVSKGRPLRDPSPTRRIAARTG